MPSLAGSWGGGRLGVLGVGERGGGMVLGLQSGQTSPRIFLRLQVRFRPGNRGLRRSVFRRTAARSAGIGGGHDGLPRVAHLLHRRSRLAAEQTDDTDQNDNEPRHRVAGH
jgi:hypothetical protein